MLPSGIAMTCMRPPTTYLLLDQHEADAGSTSALMGSTHMVMGSLGMVIVSLQLGDRVVVLGALTLAVGLLSLGFWLRVGRRLVGGPHKTMQTLRGGSRRLYHALRSPTRTIPR